MPSPFATIVNSVGSLSAGHIVLASEWNTAIGGIYTYINSTILAGGLNKVSIKGDLYVFDGAALQALPVGTNGQFLTANSGATNGVDWESAVNTTTLTTKGDLLTYSGSALIRLASGINGQVLTANSAAPNGIDWETPTGGVPLGGIILWDLSQRAMPSGYNLCDGGTYNTYVTPNTQGLYMVGAGTSAHGPAASGMGIVASGTIGGDASAGTGLGPAHLHALPATRLTPHNGDVAFDLVNTVTSATAVTPRYMALAYIMRTS